MDNREPVDCGLQFGVLICLKSGEDTTTGVTDNVDRSVFDKFEEGLCHIFWQKTIVNSLTASTVSNSSSVEGENVASESLQLQFSGKGKHPGCRTSACQDHFNSGFLNPD